jgi:hypothetical protein
MPNAICATDPAEQAAFQTRGASARAGSIAQLSTGQVSIRRTRAFLLLLNRAGEKKLQTKLFA